MASAEVLARTLRSLCRSLTGEQALQLAQVTVPVAARAGTAVLREGQRPEGLLILTHGEVEVVKQSAQGADLAIAALHGPTLLGEMSLITQRAHSATVRARTDCEFALLTKTQFARLLDADSIAAHRLVGAIAEALAHRLYRMDEKIALVAGPGNAAPPAAEDLAVFREKLFTEWSP